MQDFTDKVVLIGGAAGNLGKSVSAAFRKAGAFLALTDIHAGLLSEIYGDAGRVRIIESDLAMPDDAVHMIEQVLQAYGKIDVFISLTGGFSMGYPLHESSPESWEFMMKLNVATLFNVCHAVVPHMRDRGFGKIVTVGARAALSGRALMGAYTASKAAVIRMTEALSEENKRYGINVNCVLPSIIDTPQNRRDMPDADFSTWVSPDSLADVILFLASQNARSLHGASVPVYGLCQ
jgi:NAD(P)-dependent dehydrogenase (short-subunit alcohol dehydrogenase family)